MQLIRFFAMTTALLSVVVLHSARADTPKVVESQYDLVIRNGRVLDGAGNPWVEADIGIKDGKFAKIGRIEAANTNEIDATGKYVSPGWIDMMDQSGRVLRQNGRAENKILMGVTTVIAGEGGTPVPAGEIDQYFDQLTSHGIALNFGTYYSATQARRAVMGDAAGTPTEEQMEQMKALVATAMEQGALGITTALIYPPATFQSTDEIVELAKIAAQYGGIYASHIRDESGSLLEAIQEAIEIGERAELPVEIFHLKAAYKPGWGQLMPRAGELIEEARRQSVNIAADLYPYRAGGTGLEVTAPTWVFAEGLEKALERLKDPEIRTQLKKEIEAGPQANWSNLVHASGGWDNVMLANAYNSKYDRFRFKSIAYIAEELGEHPADVAWNIALEALPKRALALFFMMSEEDIETGLQFPWVSIGSDAAAAADANGVDALGLPHPRSYGTFPRIIAEYVRERGVLTLPDAIRKMTSWPASRMGLHDRGVIREGLWADVVIFDYEDIKDNASWEHPTAYPTGIDYVLVNGRIVAEGGVHTGVLAG
ncbi:MAG: D-aminoacylase, partial [Haliea sp.]